MKKLFIIPGWRESSQYKIYQSLGKLAEKKGYKVVFYDVDWEKSLSSQIFPVQKDTALFGFSLGAVFARLVAQDYKCRQIILASMTPLHSFKDEQIKKELVTLLGKAFIEDICKKLKSKHRASDQVIMYGDREEELGDIIVSLTGHRLNTRYNKKIAELL